MTTVCGGNADKDKLQENFHPTCGHTLGGIVSGKGRKDCSIAVADYSQCVMHPKVKESIAKRQRKIYRGIELLLHDVRNPLELWVDRAHDRIEARLIIAVADMICGKAGQQHER